MNLSFLCVSFAKLFCEVRLLQTERLGQLLGIAIQRRSVETVGIEEQRNCLHAASELALLSIEKLAALRSLFRLSSAVVGGRGWRDLRVARTGGRPVWRKPPTSKSQ